MEKEALNNAVAIIEKSASIAVALPRTHEADYKKSAEALLRMIKRCGKRAMLLQDAREDAQTPPGPRDLPDAPLRELIISINENAPLAEFYYEQQDNGATDIVLIPKNAPLSQAHISFRNGKPVFDCLIAIGIPDIETAAQESYVAHALKEKLPLINIDTHPENTRYGTVNLIGPGTSSPAECVDELLVRWEETSGKTPLSFMQLLGRASARSKMSHRDAVLWSFLTREDFQTTGRSRADVTRVLAFLDQSFPPHRLTVLAAQPPLSQKGVCVFLSGERALLDRVHALTPSRFMSPHLELIASHDTFKDAEDGITALLEKVL